MKYQKKKQFKNDWQRGSRKFWPEAEILGIFTNEVAPKAPSISVCEFSVPSI